MTVLARGKLYADMQRRALKFRIPFYRRRGFHVPHSIKIASKKHIVSCPSEHGCRIDFISIFLNDAYFLERLVAFGRNSGPILDIGANIGWFSLAARASFPEAQIHAYEPNPRPAQYLLKNTCGLDRFVFYPEAVGGRRTTIDIVVETETNMGYSIPGTQYQQIDLAEAVERAGGHIQLLKLDCEGAEWEMFADRKVWGNIAAVTMEYHLRNGRKYGELVDRLGSLGYSILRHAPSIGCGMILARRQGAYKG